MKWAVVLIKILTGLNLMHIAYNDYCHYRIYAINLLIMVAHTLALSYCGLKVGIETFLYFSASVIVLLIQKKLPFADAAALILYLFLVVPQKAAIAMFFLSLTAVICGLDKNLQICKIPFCAAIAINYFGMILIF